MLETSKLDVACDRPKGGKLAEPELAHLAHDCMLCQLWGVCGPGRHANWRGMAGQGLAYHAEAQEVATLQRLAPACACCVLACTFRAPACASRAPRAVRVECQHACVQLLA